MNPEEFRVFRYRNLVLLVLEFLEWVAPGVPD